MSEPNNKNVPAFPFVIDGQVEAGLTKREYFAAMVLSSSPQWGTDDAGRIVQIADALLAELAQPDLAQPDLSQPNLAPPTPAPEPSPGTVRFYPTAISDKGLTWWEYEDREQRKRTYNGHTVYADANGLWINTNNGFRTYLQPSAALDPLP